MNKQIPHIDDNAIVKFLSGEANDYEAELLLNWMALSDENQKEFERYEKVWSASGQSVENKRFNSDKAWEKVNNRISHRRRSIRVLYTSVAAAVVAFTVIFTQLTNENTIVDEPQFAMVSKKKPVQANLPDGSSVTLSKHSKLEYRYDSISHTRSANLSGKAFFDVVHDATKRFVVQTEYGGVEVLGTKYTVEVLENTDVEVDVLTGKVKTFLPKESGDTLFLIITDGESAIISMRRDSIIKTVSSHMTANTADQFVITITFDNLDIENIVDQLGKCFNVHIQLDSSVNKNLKFSSVFREKNLEDILDVVTQTLELKYKQKNGEYVVTCAKDEK